MTKFHLDEFIKFVANQIKFVPPFSSLHPSKKSSIFRPRKIWDFQKKNWDGELELGLLKLPTFGKKANGRVSGAPETCFFMFFGLNAAPSKTSNLSTFFKLSNSSWDKGCHTFNLRISKSFQILKLGIFKSECSKISSCYGILDWKISNSIENNLTWLGYPYTKNSNFYKMSKWLWYP